MPETHRGHHKKYKKISFDGIIQGTKSSVRVTDDGMIPVIDLIKMTTQGNAAAARKILSRIDPKVFDIGKIVKRKMQTKDGKERGTKCVSLEDAVDLVMILPGTAAKKTRSQLAEKIKPLIHCGDSGASKNSTNDQSTSPNDTDPYSDHTSSTNSGFMDIVQSAFAYQKELLELQHKLDIETLQDEEDMEEFDVLIEKKLEDIATEKITIESSITMQKFHINRLKKQLHETSTKLEKTRETILELISDTAVLCRPWPGYY